MRRLIESPAQAPAEEQVDYRFRDITVTRKYRDILSREIPGLANNPAYWRMYHQLVYRNWKDHETGLQLLPHGLIAEIEHADDENFVLDEHYRGKAFVDRFSADTGINIDLTDHVYHPDPNRRKVRCVRSFALRSCVWDAITDERARDRSNSELVWLHTGNKYLRKHTVELRRYDTAAADARFNANTSHQSAMLIDYLNNLDSHRFTGILKHLPEAYAAAKGLSDYANQNYILDSIHDQPKPFYHPVDRTMRIYAVGQSFNRLQRDLRKIVTQDWITGDLRSAQLAINATIWGIPEINEYLRSGGKPWIDLCDHMALKPTGDNKAIIKTAVYSLGYGMGNDNCCKQLGESFPSGTKAFDRFTSHPIINSLLMARSRQLRKINDKLNCGGIDAYGKFIPLEYHYVKNCTGQECEYSNNRSVLACISQSYEMKLLEPVIHEALRVQHDERGFAITSWLHDGFCFCPYGSRDKDAIMERLATLVKRQADDLGIYTSLEYS